MRVHITCSNPRRSVVIALHATREMLARSGHEVSVSWPEIWQHDGGKPEECHPAELVQGADVLIHASPPDESAFPEEVERACQSGKPFIHYMPGATASQQASAPTIQAPDGEACTRAITKLEELQEALDATIDASIRVGC